MRNQVRKWIQYGKNLFPTDKQYFDIRNGATAGSNNSSGNIINLNSKYKKEYASWIRQGIILLEGFRYFLTGQEIDYYVKIIDKENKKVDEIMIPEKEMWKFLASSQSASVGDIDISSIISTVKNQNPTEWTDSLTDLTSYLIIQNRISFMENYYEKSKDIIDFDTFYKFENENESAFIVRKNRPENEKWESLKEFKNYQICQRYKMYLEKNQIYHIEIKDGIYKEFKIQDLLYRTTRRGGKQHIGSMNINRGDLYEAVVHGAANIKSNNIEEEYKEVKKRRKKRYENYEIPEYVQNIDNMVAEKDSISYIKAGDIYFNIPKKINKNQIIQQVQALQIKLSNASIKRNTTINGLINLNLILARSDNAKIRNGLKNFFIQKISQKKLSKEVSEDVIHAEVSEKAYQQLKSITDKWKSNNKANK